MQKAMTLTMAGSAILSTAMILIAMTGAALAVSSNAHKGVGGAYGVYKSLKTGPAKPITPPRANARKQPYPYRYYTDESRGNYGCHRYGKRAIDTNNENWWVRYKACSEVGKD